LAVPTEFPCLRGIPWNSAKTRKFRGNGQIPRLGSKFRGSRKTVGPNNKSFWTRSSQPIAWLATEETTTNTIQDGVQCIWILETHCNINSKRAFLTGVFDRWHNCLVLTYLLMHKLFSSCIGRYLVSCACNWVISALSAALLIFSFQFSLLFFNILLARLHQHCGLLLALICNIGHRTLPKIWVGTFLVQNVHPRGWQYLTSCSHLLFFPPPDTTRTYTAHTYQCPSSPWAGALDRYKDLSAEVQSRLDPCPQRTNKRHSTQYSFLIYNDLDFGLYPNHYKLTRHLQQWFPDVTITMNTLITIIF